MATGKTSVATSKRSPLKASLVSTRLKKISIEALLAPKEDAGGSLVLSYNISMDPSNTPNTLGMSLQIAGNGDDKDDPGITPFTIDAAIFGLFSISRTPTKAEAKKLSLEMANCILPILADTIETALTKCGYPGIRLIKSLPDDTQYIA